MSTFMHTALSAIFFAFLTALWVAIPVTIIAFAKTMRDWIKMEKELETIRAYESV